MSQQESSEVNTGKCEIAHLVRNSPICQHGLGPTNLESSLAEKDLEVLVDKWNMSQPCVLASKANNILGCIRRNLLPAVWQR